MFYLNSNLRFTTQIYKTIDDNGKIHQYVSIDMIINDSIKLPTPINEFLLGYSYKKITTRLKAASIITQFLNYTVFDKDEPLTSLSQLTLQHGINYLSQLKCSPQVKRERARMLTKLYYFLQEKNIINLDIVFKYKENKYNNNSYIVDIFEGKYEVDTNWKKPVEVIHQIDIEYLPLFFKVAKEIAPDIYLALFFIFGGGIRASEVVSIEYGDISILKPQSLIIDLTNKKLRPDIATGDNSQVKRPRKQVVYPIGGDALLEAYQEHKHKYKVKDVSAVFVNRDGHPMTVNCFRNRFNKVKDEVINRLLKSDDTKAFEYGCYLSTYRFSTHIGRGTFTNQLVDITGNPIVSSTKRGDRSMFSILPYLRDSRTNEEKLQTSFANFLKGLNL